MKATEVLHNLGQSVWLDNITRELLDTGRLKATHASIVVLALVNLGDRAFTSSPGRYLEHFAVGQTFGSGRLRIDEKRMKSFAEEFDPQPFHLDAAADIPRLGSE